MYRTQRIHIKTIAICHIPNQQELIHILKAFFNQIGILVHTYTDESLTKRQGNPCRIF